MTLRIAYVAGGLVPSPRAIEARRAKLDRGPTTEPEERRWAAATAEGLCPFCGRPDDGECLCVRCGGGDTGCGMAPCECRVPVCAACGQDIGGDWPCRCEVRS